MDTFTAREGKIWKDIKSNVTIFGKIDHLRASTEIHFLPVTESYIIDSITYGYTIYGYIHVLPSNSYRQ